MKTDPTSIAASTTGVSISQEMIRSRDHSTKTTVRKSSTSITDCVETSDREPDGRQTLDLVQQDGEQATPPGDRLDLSG